MHSNHNTPDAMCYTPPEHMEASTADIERWLKLNAPDVQDLIDNTPDPDDLDAWLDALESPYSPLLAA